MKRAIASLAVAALLAGLATGADARRQRGLPERANPGAVIAAELAFARAAQDDGQWTAFRKFSAKDAVMFVPQPVNAHDWLKKQPDPAQAVRWQPHKVWSSCDGSLAVTKGAWQRADGSVGYFTTVWERQKNGKYLWVLDRGDTLAKALPEPEMIGTEIATCGSGPLPGAEGNVLEADPFTWRRVSRDGTMAVQVGPGLDGPHLRISYVGSAGTSVQDVPSGGATS